MEEIESAVSWLDIVPDAYLRDINLRKEVTREMVLEILLPKLEELKADSVFSCAAPAITKLCEKLRNGKMRLRKIPSWIQLQRDNGLPRTITKDRLDGIIRPLRDRLDRVVRNKKNFDRNLLDVLAVVRMKQSQEIPVEFTALTEAETKKLQAILRILKEQGIDSRKKEPNRLLTTKPPLLDESQFDESVPMTAEQVCIIREEVKRILETSNAEKVYARLLAYVSKQDKCAVFGEEELAKFTSEFGDISKSIRGYTTTYNDRAKRLGFFSKFRYSLKQRKICWIGFKLLIPKTIKPISKRIEVYNRTP